LGHSDKIKKTSFGDSRFERKHLEAYFLHVPLTILKFVRDRAQSIYNFHRPLKLTTHNAQHQGRQQTKRSKAMKQDPQTMALNYHDYANEVEQVQVEEHPHAQPPDSSHGEQNFPVKLHYMLTELETDGMDGIISWQPHGRCFLVHRQQEFVEKVLPL
jgi:hypothetical protein